MSLMSRVRDIDDVPTLAASADDNALERLSRSTSSGSCPRTISPPSWPNSPAAPATS